MLAVLYEVHLTVYCVHYHRIVLEYFLAAVIMPAGPIDFRPVCGSFIPTLIHLLGKKRHSTWIRQIVLLQTTTGRFTGVLVGFCLTYFFWGSFLLQCGDIESNPGPPKLAPATRQATLSGLAQLNEKQDDQPLAAIMKELATVSATMTSMNSKFDNFSKEMKDLKTELHRVDKDVSSLKDEMQDLRQQNANLTIENERLKSQIGSVADKTDDLENRSKRNNLLFFGIERDDSESTQSCERKVNDILTEGLGLREVQFDRAHRTSNKPNAPIVVRCTFYKDKLAILRAKKNLGSGSDVSISEDFSQRVRDIRKALIPHLKDAKKAKKNAFLVFDHLIIDNTKFTVDENSRLIEVSNIEAS